jgi:hypothetical protein
MDGQRKMSWARWPLTTYHVSLFPGRKCFVSELLDSDKNADPITNLFDTDFLENLLIAFEKVVPVEIVC